MRPRKSGPRHRNGRLRHVAIDDPGHPMMLGHRAAVGVDPLAQCAGYPLGILFLRGELADVGIGGQAADDQNAARHVAGLEFASLHASAHGMATTRSCLASMVAGNGLGNGRPSGADATERERRTHMRLNSAIGAVLDRAGAFALDVLQNVVIYQEPMRFMDPARNPLSDHGAAIGVADKIEIAFLRRALEALGR